MKLILLLLLVPLVHSFHVTRNTEIGLCTITDSNKHAHKFSCLQGDRNYCCGGRDNQSCCTVDEFANQHKTALTLILVFLVLVVVLFVLVVIGSMATIFVSTSVMKQKKRSEL